MRIVITGSAGFLGTNLELRLRERGGMEVTGITLETSPAQLDTALAGAQHVFHLAGENRPKDESGFIEGNLRFTQLLCERMAALGNKAPIVFTSSTQAALDNPYGRSKLGAEQALLEHHRATGAPVHIFRLPNVFGKWSRPNYNSVVATFCHNVSRNMPITIHDPAAPLKLVYVDDIMERFLALPGSSEPGGEFLEISPVYATTVGELASILRSFADSRNNLVTPRVGTGLVRALYATYLSHLEPEAFTYGVKLHSDPRGEFAEMLKTPDCGQISYFTAHPGVTRGDHYHHSKTEKFLVVRGTARFGFRHLITQETFELTVRGGECRIVETVPGWTHNITNIGDDELIVMLWANEVFNPAEPDTIPMKVEL